MPPEGAWPMHSNVELCTVSLMLDSEWMVWLPSESTVINVRTPVSVYSDLLSLL